MMIRTGLLAAVAGLALSASLAWAENRPVDNEDARFTFHRTTDGYLRLDGRSGEVSTCSRGQAGWLCKAVPDERAALESEIARLQSDNAALKKELLAHNLALPSGIMPLPSTQNQPRVDSNDDVKRMMGFVQDVWKRFVEMVMNVQRDILEKS